MTFRSSGKGNWNGIRRVLGAGMKVDSRNLGMRRNKNKSPFHSGIRRGGKNSLSTIGNLKQRLSFFEFPFNPKNW